MKELKWMALCVVLTGCGTPQASGPLPPPNSVAGADTSVKYSRWSDEQLQLKRAQLRRELDRGWAKGGTGFMMMMAENERNAQYKEVEEIERELLRRDPSGNLLRASGHLK
jgi:hypothetical protein